MQPLYIDGSPGCRVVLDEPALRVVVPDKADQLFPLSRVSRVVCKGVVEWSMKLKALLRLLDCLNLLIKTAEDDIRCYRLPEQADIKVLGQQYFPEDVLLFSGGVNRLLNAFD